jgi:hypothetical protein
MTNSSTFPRSSRPRWSRANRLTTYIGLLVTGALLGGAAAVACTIILGTDRGIAGIVGAAALGAAGALAKR